MSVTEEGRENVDCDCVIVRSHNASFRHWLPLRGYFFLLVRKKTILMRHIRYVRQLNLCKTKLGGTKLWSSCVGRVGT